MKNYIFQAFCSAFCVGIPALLAWVFSALTATTRNYFEIYVIIQIAFIIITSQAGLFLYYLVQKKEIKWISFIFILIITFSFFIIELVVSNIISSRMHVDGNLVFFIINILIIFIPKNSIKPENSGISHIEEYVDKIEKNILDDDSDDNDTNDNN